MKMASPTQALINKIHVNSTTKISLNDRFTVMQSVRPKSPAPKAAAVAAVPIGRLRSRSASRDRNPARNRGAIARATFANRKFLEQLEKKHKMQAALKLKRRSLKTNLPVRQRARNRIGLRKGAAANAIRLASNGRLTRANSLSNIATMKADLLQPALRRSNSTSSLSGRLGTRRNSQGTNPNLPRRLLKRNTNPVRSNSRPNQRRSASVSGLKRSNSRINLRRTNNRNNQNGQNNNNNNSNNKNNRSQSVNRRGNNSIQSRLGVRGVPNRNQPIRNQNVRGGGRTPKRLLGVAQGQGRISKRRNSIGRGGRGAAQRAGNNQGRIGRPRVRGALNNQQAQQGQRGRSRSRSNVRQGRQIQQRKPQQKINQLARGRNNSVGRKGNRGNVGIQARGRSRSRGRGGRGGGRPLVQKPEVKKEDLDKELDQYMANTRTNAMDVSF